MSQTRYRSFIRDHAIVIGGHVLVYLKTVIIMPIIIKHVGVTTYGGYVLLMSFLGMAMALSTLGTGVAFKRYMPAARSIEERRRLFFPQLIFNAAVLALVSGASLFFHWQVGEGGLAFAAWVPPLYLFLYFLYSQGTDYLRFTGRMQFMTLANLCFPYIDIAITLAYLLIRGTVSLDLLFASTSIAALLVSIGPFVTIAREIGVTPALYSRADLVADIKVGFPLLLNNVVDFLLASSDRYLIALFLSIGAVGYYVPAYTLGSLVIFMPKAISVAFPQLLARAVDEDHEGEAQTMVDYTIKGFLFVAIPFVGGCAVLGRPVLAILANEDVASRAQLVAPLVALGTLFYGLTLLLANALFVRLKTRLMFQVNLVAGLSNVAANIVLLYIYRSILVAAFTTVFSYMGAFAYGWIVARKEWRLNVDAGAITKSIGAAAVMTLVVFAMETQISARGLPAVLLLSGMGVVVYGTCLLLFGALSGRELLFLRRLVA